MQKHAGCRRVWVGGQIQFSGAVRLALICTAHGAVPQGYAARRQYILVIHQGQNVFTVFFEDILLETQLYNYGELGHFWVKGYENLRVMEYQIAILRDKYEYLGEKYCTEYEGKLAMLRDFPPLNYLFYPAVPEKYIVPVDNPWEVTAEALAVMQELATEAGDEKLGKMLRRYEKNSDISNAKKIEIGRAHV